MRNKLIFAKELRSRAPASSLGNALLCFVFFLLFLDTGSSNTFLYLGDLLIIAASFIRAWLSLSKLNVAKFYRLYTKATILTSAAWSATLYYGLTHADQKLSALIGALLVSASLMAASVYTLMPVPRLMAIYNTIIIIPLSYGLYIASAKFNIGANILFALPSYYIFIMMTSNNVKKDFKRLIENERQLSSLLEALPAGISLIRKNIYLMANKTVTRRFLKHGKTLVGREVGAQDSGSSFVKYLRAFAASREDQKIYEDVLQTNIGPRNHLIILKKIAKSDGDIIAVSLDTEDKKQIEQQLANQQAQIESSAKLALLGEMSSGIAHEINNPISIIIAKSSLMLRKIEKNKNVDKIQLVSDLQGLQKTAERVAKIIAGLKTFSRESPDDPMKEVLLSDVINETVSLCESKVKYSGVDLKVDIPADLTIYCRPTQLSQVILNLIGNSVDAIESLEAKWIKVSAQSISEDIVIRVTDSGNGIPPQIRDKVMNSFFTTKEFGKGTGLGLSISTRIIEAHGGQMYFDHSQPNTTAMIKLPKPTRVANAS